MSSRLTLQTEIPLIPLTQGATSGGECFLFVVFISSLLFEDHFTDIVRLGIQRPEPETSFSTIKPIL